jgi:hypothetical protein
VADLHSCAPSPRHVILVDAVRDPKIGEKIRLGLVKVFSMWSDE